MQLETQMSASQALVLDSIGNFRLVRRLGRGGMGEVWLGEHHAIGTRVAIKLLLGDFGPDDADVQRFFNEARAVGRIRHAGIAKIFDVGLHRDRAYLIMEHLEGETIGQRLARLGRLPQASYLELGRQIASVLDATHTAGITHRDLKPDNVFVVPDHELPCGERAKVLDFGIAKLTGTLAGGSPRTLGAMGTPAYMAPEQWGDPSKIDWRADLYAFGCLLFEMACGRPPFQPTTVGEACQQHLHETPPDLRSLARAADPAFAALVASLLAKDPAARPASMRAVEQALARIAHQPAFDVLGATAVESPIAPVTPHAEARSDGPMRPVRRRSTRLALSLAVFLAAGTATTLVRGAVASSSAPDDTAAVAASPSHEPAVTPHGVATPTTAHPVTPPSATTPVGAAGGHVASSPPPKEGTIDEAELVRVLTSRARQLHDCYQPHAELDPSATGRIVVTFTIGLDGRASSLSATGMTDVISGCVLSVIRTTVFPRPVGGPVPVTYPISFEPVVTDLTKLTVVPGGDDPDFIALRTIEPNLAACARSQSVHGRVRATINYSGSGQVSSVQLDRGLTKTPFARCLKAEVAALTFTNQGTDGSITVPLTFR